MKNIRNAPILLILFCFLSISIMVLSLAKKDVEFSRFENRTLEYLRHPTLESVISGEWETFLETYCTDQIIGRNSIIESNSRLMKALGKRQINGITIGYDGTLMQASSNFPSPNTDLSKLTQDVLIPCKEAASSYGGQLYYMNIFPRMVFFWDQFPYHEAGENINDYLKAGSDSLSGLSSYGIYAVDTYPIISSHNDEYLYFKTDHHYTLKGAYYSYLALLDSINEHNPDKAPLTFPEWESMQAIRPGRQFWGSLVSQIGDTEFEGLDYLEYALPDDFPSDYERLESGEVSDMPLIRDDDIEEYGWFMNGDYGNTVIKTNRPELPNILIIGYSFSDALELLAVYNFNEMHSIDPRMFEGDITQYIRDVKCDYVVIQGTLSITE